MSSIQRTTVLPKKALVSLKSDQHMSVMLGTTTSRAAARMVSASVLPARRDVCMNIILCSAGSHLFFSKYSAISSGSQSAKMLGATHRSISSMPLRWKYDRV